MRKEMLLIEKKLKGGDKMRKILALIVMFSLLSLSFAIAGIPTEIIIGQQATVFTIGPSKLDFGSVIPGATPESIEPITFSVTSGNSDITLQVTDITGDPLFDSIQASDDGKITWEDLLLKSDVVECVGDPCTFPETLTWNTKLFVPSKTKAEKKEGTIVYTVTGAP